MLYGILDHMGGRYDEKMVSYREQRASAKLEHGLIATSNDGNCAVPGVFGNLR
ncbi:hypothetical protein [Fuerstiella marisgermanici]|uniref:hypothetical protein n=1 Tax=Fuerstiella marisgermanici TaxID=1891926 RepID=UPI001313DB91|nr:hypothetical protein [Fuerstiella marisgermanici]